MSTKSNLTSETVFKNDIERDAFYNHISLCNHCNIQTESTSFNIKDIFETNIKKKRWMIFDATCSMCKEKKESNVFLIDYN